MILKNLNEVLYSSAGFNKNNERIEQINKGVLLIKEKTMSIDETTRKIEEEQARKDTPKKQGVVKKIITYGLILFSLGIYHPKNVQAGNASLGNTKDKNELVVTPNGGPLGYTSNGPVVFSKGSPLGRDPKGNAVIRHVDEETNNNYQSTTLDYDALIKKDPTNAKLYIAKADEMIRKKAPPQEIINTLEIVSQKKNLNANRDELIWIHSTLASNYNSTRKYNNALIHLEKIKNLNPNYPSINYSIKQLRNLVKN